MRPEPMRCSRRCALFAPTVDVCLRPVFWPDFTSFRLPFSVFFIIFLDTSPRSGQDG
jgi:hypothetical protein